MTLTHQTVGNVGLYYVCYKLSRMGWNVMPTARNARGIDILAYSTDAKRTRTIQVKSLSRSQGEWRMSDMAAAWGHPVSPASAFRFTAWPAPCAIRVAAPQTPSRCDPTARGSRLSDTAWAEASS